jgi:hypothetical protein
MSGEPKMNYSARVYKDDESYYLVSSLSSGHLLKSNARDYEYCGSGNIFNKCYGVILLSTTQTQGPKIGEYTYITENDLNGPKNWYDSNKKYTLVTGPEAKQKILEFNTFYSSKMPNTFFGSKNIINPEEVTEEGLCLKKSLQLYPLTSEGNMDKNISIIFPKCDTYSGGKKRKTKKDKKFRKSRKSKKVRKYRK